MLITSKHGKGNKIHLHVDGEYTITTTERVWYDSGYSDGAELSDEEWSALCESINFAKMYARALDLLDLRDHSRREIVDKLVTKYGYDKRELANAVCDKLAEGGLLDDERFAHIYADELVRRKHVSPTGLRAALSAKGVGKGIIDMILDELELNPIESISYFLDTKFRDRDLTDDKQCEKTITALYRLGFSISDIKNVITNRQNS
ncbi:MAG: regulatory protein RecX [Clostridia bacterium]|nr:regulatory protein RecX [Clostridia bacterium]